MLTIKGFVTISPYVNNIPGGTSILGELSTWATTYTKEKGEYQDPNIPEYKFIAFESKDINTGDLYTVSEIQVTEILNIVKQSILYANGHIRPYNVEDFRNTISVTLAGAISNLELGAFIDNGTIALPEWISWINVLTGDNVKIWLANNSFIEQFDGYEILVIPPISNLDSMFGSYTLAVETIQSRTLQQVTELIEETKGVHPETYIRSYSFNYFNPNSLSQTTPTDWTVVIYGKAGDNIDSIKDAMANYVLANSTHSREEWEVIVPELMKRTEFVILPRWDKMSIPNLTLLSGLYSSMMNPIECLQFAKDNVNFYDDAWIESNTTIMPFDYKALSLVVINGNSNMEGKDKINEIFDDYIPVSSMVTDFNRMRIFTRDWIIMLEQLLITAETATKFTTVPQSFRRIERDGIIFISKIYDNVNYLVAVRSNEFITNLL